MQAATYNTAVMNTNRYAMEMCMSFCVVMEMCGMMMCQRFLPESYLKKLLPTGV